MPRSRRAAPAPTTQPAVPHNRRQTLAALATLPLLAAVPRARAQAAWPAAKPITWIVPFTAGGSVDAITRLVAPRLAARLGQSIVVENVAGAGGVIGVAKAVAAAPDGYTVVSAPDSVVSIGQLINPGAYRFDPLKDLAPVGMVNTAPMVLVARPGLGVKTFAELVKLAKASPGKLNYATSGQGTVLHLAMEQLKQRAGIFITHIPYRGGAQILTDVIGNQIDLAMMVSASAIPMILDRSIVALGITDARRLEVLPGVPTFDEMPGLKGTVMNTWTGLYAPATTPPEILARLNTELAAVLHEPAVVAKLREQGALPGSGTGADLARFAQTEAQRNASIVKTLSFKD